MLRKMLFMTSLNLFLISLNPGRGRGFTKAQGHTQHFNSDGVWVVAPENF